MVFVSTGGYSGRSADEVTDELNQNNIFNVELSGGKYKENLIQELEARKSSNNFRLHNYFPPPETPFVFNLASPDETVATKSLKHVENAIILSARLDNTVFGFHAGFLMDPKPVELGKRIKSRQLYDREDCLNIFLERVNRLSDFAMHEGVELLIENNVISKNNFDEFGVNAFLMATPDECEFVMKNTATNVNMLLDVAHLKVSANSLDFDPAIIFSQCKSWIKGYHLSDNCGKRDSNECVTDDSWFWQYIDNRIDYLTLEIYNVSIDIIKSQLELVKDKLNGSKK